MKYLDKHRHGEAFNLMNYRCSCGYEEVIWNSRDGVTPFATKCAKCNQLNLQHVDWAKDVYAPEHKLKAGERYWRDGTPDEAEEIIKKRIERSKSSPYPIPEKIANNLIEQARNGEGEFQKGWPMLDVAKEETK